MWIESLTSGRRTATATRGRLWWLTVVILAGAALRINLLTDFRFHSDEALFATLGRLIISGQDPLLRHATLLVDKPPLFYGMLAGGISLNWVAEISARLPGLFASILSLALAARLAGHLWRSNMGIVGAAAMVALSPFAIQFSPTAFADSIVVMWVLSSLVAVTEGRWGWAGVLIGCATATKQSGLVFLPLVAAVGMVQHIIPDRRPLDVLCWLGKLLAGFSGVLALIAAWVWARRASVTFWQAGVAVNDPGRIIRAEEVWPRLLGWGDWLGYTTASWWLNLILVAWAIGGTWWLVLQPGRERRTAQALVLLAFISAYLGLLWLVAFPVLDRYLLPVVVLGLVLVAGLAGELVRIARLKQIVAVGLVLVVAAMIPHSIRAAHGAYSVGGDHGQFDGIDDVATTLDDLPEGSVVYYTSLGWPLAYYLFDAPVYLASVDSGAALVEDLTTFAVKDSVTVRMLVLPGWESQTVIVGPAVRAGFEFEPVLRTTNRWGERTFVVYRIWTVDD